MSLSAIIAAFGAAVLAIAVGAIAWAKAKVSSADKEHEKDEAQQAAVIAKQDGDSAASAQAHNDAVAQANAAKESIHEAFNADISAVAAAGADDNGLRNGADAVAAAVDRANGGV